MEPKVRISKVSQDWIVKGCHIHVAGVEVALRPDHRGGMIMDTLQHFLNSGELGGLAEGMSMDEVRRRLGEPEDVSLQKKPTIWKYGSVQLAFYKDSRDEPAQLTWIALYWRAPFIIPSGLSWIGWLPDVGTSIDSVRHFLTKAGIAFSVRQIAEGESFALPSGAWITFDQQVLDSIQFTVRARPKKRQLALALPEDVWQRVNDEAKRRQVSPAHLCSEWINDRLHAPAQ